MALVDAPTRRALLATAAAQPHDPGFVPFVRRAQAAGIPVEVVIGRVRVLHRAGAGAPRRGGPAGRHGPDDLRRTGGRAIDFPNGHPTCFVCGTCKRNRVLAHQAAGRAVVFIGDGESDRYAAGYSDVVFAKRALVPHLRRGRLAVPALDRVRRDRRLARRDARRLAADPATLAVPQRAGRSSAARRSGATASIDPPPGSWPPGLTPPIRALDCPGASSDSIGKTPGGPDPWRSMSL